MSFKNFFKKAKDDTKKFWEEEVKPEAKRLENFWNREVEPAAEKLWNKTKEVWNNITSSDNASTKEDCSLKNSIKTAIDEVAKGEPTAESLPPTDLPQEEVTTSGDTGTDTEQ